MLEILPRHSSSKQGSKLKFGAVRIKGQIRLEIARSQERSKSQDRKKGRNRVKIARSQEGSKTAQQHNKPETRVKIRSKPKLGKWRLGRVKIGSAAQQTSETRVEIRSKPNLEEIMQLTLMEREDI